MAVLQNLFFQQFLAAHNRSHGDKNDHEIDFSIRMVVRYGCLRVFIPGSTYPTLRHHPV
jgi:hypothetical protein